MIICNTSITGYGSTSSSSAIHLYDQSSATIINSSFIKNIAVNGSCFHVGSQCGISFTNSTFVGNKARESGGVAFCESESNISFQHCFLLNNRAYHTGQFWRKHQSYLIYGTDSSFGGGVIKGHDKITITFRNCSMRQNMCQRCSGSVLNTANGGNLYIEKSTFSMNVGAAATVFTGHKTGIVIHNSTFFGNQKGTIFSKNLANIRVSQSYFISNFAHTYGSVIVGWSKSRIELKNSFFLHNMLLLLNIRLNYGVGPVFCWKNCVVFVTNVTFGQNYPGVIFVHHNSTLEVKHSIFQDTFVARIFYSEDIQE